MLNKEEYFKKMKQNIKIVPRLCNCGAVILSKKNTKYVNIHYNSHRHNQYLQDNLLHLLDL